MKIAFLCEGDSEYESITVLLRTFDISSYRYLGRLADMESPQERVYYVYRHNYHGIGKIRKEYWDFSRFLIDAKHFSRVFVWFDNGNTIPVCEYARAQYDQIGPEYKETIDLILSARCLENWFLSNVSVLSRLLKQPIDNNYLASRSIRNFLGEPNVDILNAQRILARLKKRTAIENLPKYKVAAKFFSLIDLNLEYKSDSFSRFLTKMNGLFDGQIPGSGQICPKTNLRDP